MCSGRIWVLSCISFITIMQRCCRLGTEKGPEIQDRLALGNTDSIVLKETVCCWPVHKNFFTSLIKRFLLQIHQQWISTCILFKHHAIFMLWKSKKYKPFMAKNGSRAWFENCAHPKLWYIIIPAWVRNKIVSLVGHPYSSTSQVLLGQYGDYSENGQWPAAISSSAFLLTITVLCKCSD